MARGRTDRCRRKGKRRGKSTRAARDRIIMKDHPRPWICFCDATVRVKVKVVRPSVLVTAISS